MTIEIRELVIQAQVTQGSSKTTSALQSLGRNERDRLVNEITRQVLEQLREKQERTL